MSPAEELLFTFLMLCWSVIYHPLIFFGTVFSSAAIARLLASIIFDALSFPGISRYYFDVLLMLTVYPYIVCDVVICCERLLLQLLEVKDKISRRCTDVYPVVQTFLGAYVLGASYGLVISMFNQRLRGPKDEANILPSPLNAMITVSHVTIETIGNGMGERVADQLFKLECASYLETCFVLAAFVPVYCTIRCFNNPFCSKEEWSMRLHFWYFLWSIVSCFRSSIWTNKRCMEYLMAFLYEIVESFYFVMLPLIITFVLTKDTGGHTVFSLCKILFAVIMSGALLLAEKALSHRVQFLLEQNKQARYMASVCLLYLASFPLFIMYFVEENALPSESFWFLKHKYLLQVFISLVAYCAYGCSKLLIRNLLPALSCYPVVTEVCIVPEKPKLCAEKKEEKFAITSIGRLPTERSPDQELLLP